MGLRRRTNDISMLVRTLVATLALVLTRVAGAPEPPPKKFPGFLPMMALFDKYGVDDKIPGEKIDALLKRLKAPSSFRWRAYDTDKDGRLSRKEVKDFKIGLNGAVENWFETLKNNPEHIEE